MPDFPGTLKAPRLAAAPAGPALGQLYYDTGTNTLYWWNGTAWVSASSGPVDGAPATPSLRTLGTGAQQAAPGTVDAAPATGSVRTLGTGAQQACAGNDARLTQPIPIDLRNPDPAAGGMVYPLVYGLTAWQMWNWVMTSKQDGSVYGICRVPPGFTTAAAVEIELAASVASAGNAYMQVLWALAADGGNLNPAALNAIAAQAVPMPAAAYTLKKASFALGSAPTSGSLLIVRIYHNGTNAADTVSGSNVLLLGAYLTP